MATRPTHAGQRRPPIPVPPVGREQPFPPIPPFCYFFVPLLVLFFIGFLLPRSPPPPQLFVSFRGNELRNGFVSHVVKALREAGVNVFIDSDELKGRDIQSLFNRIDNSKMALVIFSDRFSESQWCLNELARIDKRVKEGQLIVIPVFYRVSTEDVKTFNGRFGDHFTQTMHERSSQKEPLVDLWLTAVQSVASKTGFTSEVHRMDSDLVDAIMQSVKKQLPHLSTAKKKLPISKELFYALLLAGLCKLIAPLVFNDTKVYKDNEWLVIVLNSQWFVGVSFLVIVIVGRILL